MRFKILLPVVIVALFVIALVYGFGLFQTQIPVETALVTKGDIATYIEERGKTRLPRTYRITMPMNGRILPIELSEGSIVKKGDIIARVEQLDLETMITKGEATIKGLAAQIVENDDTRMELNALKQFDAFLKSMDRTVEAAEAQTESSKASAVYAAKEYGRVSTLAETKTVTESARSKSELLKIETNVAYRKDILTLRSVQAIQSGMLIGRASIGKYIEKKELRRSVLEQQKKEAEAQLELLKRDHERSLLRSPVDGIVLKRYLMNHRMVSSGTMLLEIGQLEQLEIEAEILSQDVINIHKNNSVEIHGPAIGEQMVAGKVHRIYPQGFTKVSSLGVEQQRVLVLIKFQPDALKQLASDNRKLGVDYRVQVRIITNSHSNVLTVPRSALFRGKSGDWNLFVNRNNIANQQRVKIGLRNDLNVEIIKGIHENDQIIVAPPASLVDGQSIEVNQILKIHP